MGSWVGVDVQGTIGNPEIERRESLFLLVVYVVCFV